MKSKKLAIIGIGNELHGDDGFGPVMIEKLEGRIDQKLIDCGVSPENFTSEIIKEKPDAVIFLDAANFEGNTGSGDIHDRSEAEVPRKMSEEVKNTIKRLSDVFIREFS